MTDGRIVIGGVDRGGGFVISEAKVVTAAHVVQSASTNDVSFEADGGSVYDVAEIDADEGLDIAMLRLTTSAVGSPITVAAAITGDQWTVTTRPAGNDAALTGSVTIPARRIRNQAGTELELARKGSVNPWVACSVS